VCSATAFGFLFVILFYQGKSLLPCIAAHSTINALSAFANEAGMTPGREITMALVLCVTAAGYGVILNKRLPDPAQQ
jgi:membrane protease YdiL (CAAX protease family)